MSGYITFEERLEIESMIFQRCSFGEIAKKINKDRSTKQHAYTVLMMLKTRIDIQGEHYVAISGIIKGIEHLLQHDDEKDKPIIKSMFAKKNKQYLNFVVWLVKSVTTSFNFELRLRCANLIKLFADNKTKNLDKEFEDLRELLAHDSRKSIRNILN